jgi:hypothetical protein
MVARMIDMPKHAKICAAKATAKRQRAMHQRLITIDGKVEVLGDVAARLGIDPRRLSRLYAEGCRTTEAILARARRAT